MALDSTSLVASGATNGIAIGFQSTAGNANSLAMGSNAITVAVVGTSSGVIGGNTTTTRARRRSAR